ncbi:SDR family oxidoreductase [Yinghuangia sp. ASG 101]|uniref:SDR family oxidoreductase n=1 Tax=Yinghuangia sp. ASG 101 TaxID=2896848 RepID=UPI001E38C088|nr:SDR family oxidoreductase [Yinghuangia sp. ASG 101]UGQ13233.1 SDR family oxidoreductase [Yinghuangia sp. ASG 101]
MRFRGQVALATGAAWGIGTGHARTPAAARAGAMVAETRGKRGRRQAAAPDSAALATIATVVPAEDQNAFAQEPALRNMGMVRDTAGAPAVLLSDDASWVTGQETSIDGGQVVRL